jgi:hypothetical protein
VTVESRRPFIALLAPRGFSAYYPFMRWLFADPQNPEEAAYLQRTLAAIDAWWQAFQQNASRLAAFASGSQDWDVDAFFEQWLMPIDRRLVWELLPGANVSGLAAAAHRLVVTTEGDRRLRPLLQTFLQRAPTLPDWQFLIYRPAELVEQAARWVRNRAGVDVTGALVEVRQAPGRKIDLYYFFPSLAHCASAALTEQAWLVTEAILGEQVLDAWVGQIVVIEPAQAGQFQLLPLAHAQAVVVALIRSYQQQLPLQPVAERARQIAPSSITLSPPPPALDYPDWTDLVQAATRDPELFRATHSGQPFVSACHSRHGEVFAYLKIEKPELAGDALLPASWSVAELAFRCDAVLRQAKVGCVWGEGSGLRYHYLELALTDAMAAVQPLRGWASEQRLPVRSWLLWHDDDLGGEWVGLHPHSPPPPQGETPLVAPPADTSPAEKAPS